MKILIREPHAAANVLGGLLARLGHEVILLGESPHLKEVEKGGLRITGAFGEYHVKALSVYPAVDAIPDSSRSDVVFLLNAADAGFFSGQIPPEKFLVLDFSFTAQITAPGFVTVENTGTILVSAFSGAVSAKKPHEMAYFISLTRIPARSA